MFFIFCLFCFSLFFQKKQISYLANSCGWHQNLETIVISEGKTPGCNAGQNEVFNVSVALPLLAPTDWTTSHIVKVRYYCRVNKHIFSMEATFKRFFQSIDFI